MGPSNLRTVASAAEDGRSVGLVPIESRHRVLFAKPRRKHHSLVVLGRHTLRRNTLHHYRLAEFKLTRIDFKKAANRLLCTKPIIWNY